MLSTINLLMMKIIYYSFVHVSTNNRMSQFVVDVWILFLLIGHTCTVCFLINIVFHAFVMCRPSQFYIWWIVRIFVFFFLFVLAITLSVPYWLMSNPFTILLIPFSIFFFNFCDHYESSLYDRATCVGCWL